jgi:hypothetical protein
VQLPTIRDNRHRRKWMTDEELDEIFVSLSDILVDSGLDWVVAQVNDNVQIGRVVTRTFHRGEPGQVAELDLATKPTSNTIVGTDPYGAAERVALLISALRVALADSAALEGAVGSFLSRELSTVGSTVVISAPDQEISGEHLSVIAGGENPAQAAAARVIPLLDELARRIA